MSVKIDLTKCLLAIPLLGFQTQAARKIGSGNKVDKPNVLLVITDDQGIGDFGFINPLVKTPNIDQLSFESALYTNFVACPASSPSRVSLYTGRNHLVTGVWGVPPRSNMQTDETLMPRFLKSAGYATFLLGKRDCTQPVGCEPWEAGWDNGFTVTGYQQKDPGMGTKNGMIAKTGYTSDIMSDEAVKFIQSNREHPWFVSLNYITPHMPWVCAPEFAAPYKAAGYSDHLANCWGAITQMDAALGRVLETIRKIGSDKNTIVILYSDNGATGPEVQKLVGKVEQEVPGADWQFRNALRLRAYKSSTYQNGVRVPMMIKFPEVVQPGKRRQFARVEDVLPTLLELTDIDPSQTIHQPFDGVSIVPNLKNEATKVSVPPAFRINIAHEGAPRTKNGIIEDPSKLKFEDHHLSLQNEKYVFHSLPGAKQELYDLTCDPGEKNNIAQLQPEITKQMAAVCLAEWNKTINSGRAFNMPALQVGRQLWDGNPEMRNIFSAGYLKYLRGKVMQASQICTGFSTESDEAGYRLRIVTPGMYYIFIRGAHLDKCLSLKMEIAGKTLTGQVLSENEVYFGSVRLDKNTDELKIKTSGNTASAESADIYSLVFAGSYDEGKSVKPLKIKNKNTDNNE